MNTGYTFDVTQDQLCRVLSGTLREVDPVNADAKILSAENSSDGNMYELERILHGYIYAARVANDVMAALNGESECTCLPLDGGLGATTCAACKRAAGESEIEF